MVLGLEAAELDYHLARPSESNTIIVNIPPGI